MQTLLEIQTHLHRISHESVLGPLQCCRNRQEIKLTSDAATMSWRCWAHGVCAAGPMESVLLGLQNLCCWAYGICDVGPTESVLLGLWNLRCWAYRVYAAGPMESALLGLQSLCCWAYRVCAAGPMESALLGLQSLCCWAWSLCCWAYGVCAGGPTESALVGLRSLRWWAPLAANAITTTKLFNKRFPLILLSSMEYRPRVLNCFSCDKIFISRIILLLGDRVRELVLELEALRIIRDADRFIDKSF
eukprot:g40550.t1